MRRTCLFTLAGLALLAPAALPAADIARGVVFEDRNANGRRDAGEPGIAGVPVSNRRDVVLTDAEGRYALPVGDDDIIFVTKPTNYAVPVNKLNIPQHYYVHRPAGSPTLYYRGVAPTGPLPESIDFPLVSRPEPEKFSVVVFSDPQPQTIQEVRWIQEDVLQELLGTRAVFGLTLGDIMFDDLDLFDPYNTAIAHIGIPFYNVLGNHDMNFDAVNDEESDETFTRHFGPANYSWRYGKVHFIALDNIVHNGRNADGRANYTESLSDAALDWLANDIAVVPDDYLVVIAGHAPFWNPVNKRAVGNLPRLLEILSKRQRVLALSGHTHYNSRTIYGAEQGWTGPGSFQELNCVTVCGSWWSGPKDVRGVAIADSRDGTPNGYTVAEFDGTDYKLRFKAAGLPADFQMRIYPPGQHNNGDAPARRLLANIFYGAPGDKVEYSLNGGEWLPMAFTPQKDPLAQALYEGPVDSGKPWVNASQSWHIWEARLDERLPAGSHVVTVRSTTIDGEVIESSRIFNR
jgi:hypothetical protein